MKKRILFVLSCVLLTSLPVLANDVVINEIMYHPYHTAAQAEDVGQEWVELFNRGTNAVNLAGWRLSKGVQFTFTNSTIPPGGYLVVTANRTNFVAHYPAVTSVVGDWIGRLSNTDDDIRLLDATGEEVDRVAYADSGDWAVRARESADALGLRGWGWLAPQDGEGMTLELINASMPNNYGQNWAASTVVGGTPGAANSVAATNTAPFIQDVSHFPLVPKSTESVVVNARIDDEQASGLTVTLYYRNATSASPPAFTALTMFDDGAHGDDLPGDGLFGATIPAQANNTVVEFYVNTTDSGARNRTWPAPARNAPDLGGAVLPPESGANALYAVDDSAYTGTQPFYRIIMTETERAFLASIQGSLRNSDAAAHGVFISVDPNGTEEHQLSTFRRRGAGSRSVQPPSYRVGFATDHRWKGVTAINLNTLYTHSQVAGSVISALSGLQAELQKPIQVRVNNTYLGSAGSPQFGSYAQEEVPDGDYAVKHFPEDSNGNLYRASSSGHTATLAWLGTDPNAYIPQGYSKTSNGAENDWSDFINLIDVLNNMPDANYVTAMRQRVNVEEWMLYFAVFTLLDSEETSLGTGVGDDFEMYRGDVDTRFQILGHDFDTIFGQGDTGGNVNDNIFRATAVAAVNRFMKRPEFAPIYYRTLTNLIATAFSAPQVGAVLDQHLSSWVSPGVIASMKTFSANRNAGVLAQIPLGITITHSLTVQGGYPRATVNSVALSGLANAITTRSVLVNGAPAVWTQWSASWSATAALQPGINRVIVQSLDENGREFARAYLDVWFDSGAVVNFPFDVNDDITWTPAGGPYYITTNINVVGGQLTILPGTTVYFAPGASLTVQPTGWLFAEGTDTQHIHFGKNPAVAGNWGSLDFLGTAFDNRLAYVDFDSCGGKTIGGHNAQLHVNNSVVYIDHCSWPPTPVVEYISFDASSFIVQNSYFPSYPPPTGPESLHGINGIPVNGYGIFRDNYFGHTWGFNDTIDFTGGNRPGAILQFIGNVFDGASDDCLDLDSTDAWIEGNVFMHVHRDPTRTDQAIDTGSAISGGVDFLGQNSDWTIINNLFYDVDHVFLNKGNSTTIGNGGGRVAFLYNTVAHVARENSGSSAAEIAVFDWSDDNIALPDPAIGSGLYAAHNIIYDAPALQRFYNSNNLAVIMENNIFPTAFQGTTNQWTGPGTGNQYVDPRLNLDALSGIAVSNVTAVQLRSAFTLRSGSPALGAGFGGRDLGGLNPHGLVIGGEPRGTNSSTSATLAFGPGGTFNWGTNAAQPWGWTAFKWKLDNGPWSAVIPVTNLPPFTNPPTISLSNLSPGPHTVYAVGRNDAGYFQDDLFAYPTNSAAASNITASRTWIVSTNFSRLVINEVLAHNTSTLLVDGKYPDLVELHNAGTATVDLGDMSLTDDPAEPRKFVFDAGTTMAPGEHLVLYAATAKVPGHIYLGFTLNDAGEGVHLYDRLANGGGLLDAVAFGLQLPDLSIGRLADGVWGLTKPTFGSANVAQPVGEPSRLKINEWLAASGEIFQSDFIELFNPDPLPVALGGLGLSDAPMSTPLRRVIPPLSFIAGSGWRSFVADGNAAAGADHLNFHLDANGGWISLAQPDGQFIDLVVYATQIPDVSQGRSPDGAATYVTFNQPTPGAGNPGQTIVITSTTTTLVPLTKTWRMEASGVNLGTAWRATNYNDASWFSGPALFWAYDGGAGEVPPIPANSTIPFTSPKQSTVYFRTTFNFSGSTAGANFLLSQVIDDGCVLYLNNQEIYRYNMPAGTVSYTTLAATTISGAAAVISGVSVALPNLVLGTNYLAVELHQANLASSDLAMAIQIDEQQLVTNYLNTPIVLNEVFTKNNSFTNASGKAVDWVELYNPSTNTVDISDLSLTDDTTRPRRWVFPQGATVAPLGYYVVEFDDSAPYTPFNAGFQLSADSGAVYLFHRPAAGGALLDSVVYGVQVADLALGRATPGQNTSWTLTTPTRAAANVVVPLGSPLSLKVNEWMPNPAGNAEDWFEIYNPNAQPVALGGLHLTDDLSNPIKHPIRALSFIGSGPEAFLKFTADNNTFAGGDHVNFKLANTEAIGLYTAPAVPALIDAITFTNAPKGVSQGRLPDGSTNIVYFPDSASPEESNWLPLTGSVVVNEALTRAAAPLEQAIELRNPGDVDVAVSGWFLSNARKDLKRFAIPAGAVVSAGGFKVFYAAQFNPNPGVPPSFALKPSKDDEILLSVGDANGNLTGYRTSVKFGPAAANVSFGRYEKSTGDDFVAMSARTFGADNPATVAQFRTGAGAANGYPLVGPLVINEIHYHPPDVGTNDNTLDEFIEIANATASPVPLYDVAHPTNTWRLRTAVDFDFPTNVTVPAYDYVLVVSFNPATNAAALVNFRVKHGLAPGVVILGPWTGKLANSSGTIDLLRPDAPLLPPSPDSALVPYILVDSVKYSDSAPWPSAADGSTNGVGLSLQRMVALDYGNDPLNWIAAPPTPSGETGPAGGQPPTLNSAPVPVVAVAGGNVTFSVSAAGAAPLRYQWRFNGAALLGATNATLALSNIMASSAGYYSVIVANQWGSILGGPARLSVQAPPQIAQQPQSRAVLVGTATTFIVTASGGALDYQWRFNGTNLPGATNAALTLGSPQLADTGGYDVRVHNGLGSVTSLVATLTVLVQPSFTAQPQDITAIIGTSAAFMATATGTAPLSFQWRRNGTNLAGATNVTLNIGSVQPTDAGNYTLVVTNVAGFATSTGATLNVVVPPTVTVIASDAYASEPGTNTGTFTFTRTGGTVSNLVINYTVSGSAAPGSDYVALTGSVTIPTGASATNVIVIPLNDLILEGDETVSVTLTSNANYLVGSPSSATVVIHDDDNAPPVISINTPTNQQLFVTTPANVSFTVTASDPDGTVTKVEYFADSTNKLGESVTPPFDFIWTNAPAGSNSLTARATDSLGSTADSPPVAVVLNAQPAVTIVNPVNGASFTTPATISVSVVASDTDGVVARVEFYAGAILFATLTNAPFSTDFNTVALGNYPLVAVAVDDRGARATSAVVSVTVNSSSVVLTDAFASRPSASGVNVSATGNNTSATRETGEPAAYNSGTKTVWMQWNAPADGTCNINLCGSSFDTVLAVYTNTTAGAPGVSTLALIVQDDDDQNGICGVQSRVAFTATAGVAYQIRVEGYSSSSGSIVLNLSELVTTGPPLLVSPPTDQYALLGSSAFFSVGVSGSSPFTYQWRFYGTNLPGATNSTLALNNVITNMVGPYSVTVTNPLGGLITSNVLLSVIEANSEYFRINALTTNNAATLEHYQLTGYDSGYVRGGLGVSAAQVIASGGTTAGRFSAVNLTGGATLGTHYDALVTDLRTETVYCFGTNATGPAISSSQATTLTHLLELNGATGLLTGNAIPLSVPITLIGAYGDYGFFSGYGRAVLRAGTRVFHVALPSGAVADLGTMSFPAHNYSYNWGYWGLAESAENGLSLIQARDSQTMVRVHVPDGTTTNLATYQNLGYYLVSMSMSVPRGRWYFDTQYGNQFAPNGTATLGYADAQFALGSASNLPPTVVVAPQSAQALQGGRAAFAVSAVGAGTLGYQWRFNGVDLPGALAPGYIVADAQPDKAGSYSVVITNAFGAVTSGPVALALALPPVITSQPQGQTVLAGTAVAFTVAHSGDGTFTYYWKFNGADAAVTSSNSLVIPSANFYQNGNFSVEVRNAVGVAVSSNALLVVLSPPFFVSAPAGRELLRGMNASLAGVVDGNAPIYLQWRKDGVDLAGATNGTLGVVGVQASDAGGYTLVATNSYGSVTSGVAVLAVLEPDANSFAIKSLGTNNAVVADVFPTVGYPYDNGYAVSLSRVFLNSSSAAGGFSAADLSGGFSLGGVRYGLVGDLKSRKIYSLGFGSSLLGYGGTVTSLIELDGVMGLTTTNVITLSTNGIYMGSYSAVFSGYGRVVLLDGNNQVWDIALPSGQVTARGTQSYFNYVYAQGFAYRGWGIAESIGTNLWLAHVRDAQTIERVRVPDGASETIATFSNLGSYGANFAVCLPRQRWYFNFQGTDQFGGGGNNNLVSASASFVYLTPTNLPPTLLDQPASRFALVGSTVLFSGQADGSEPLRYQWRLQGGVLAGQTNATLTLTNVHAVAEGGYSVVVSNTVGAITSVVATLTVNYGATSTNTVALVAQTGSLWKYNQTAAFFNTAWITSNYNDSAWSSGNAGLAVEVNPALTPLIQTALTLGRTSYYFRCYFNVTSNFPAGTLLRATTYIDDGAVIYMNGHEFTRIRMPASGTINANTFAPIQAPVGGDAGQEFFYGLASTNLILGTNVIAAEVHQASATSSDIFWVMGLDALVPTANRPPIITNQPTSRTLTNGVNTFFSVGASGNAPLTFQWRFNGTNLPGATGQSLPLLNVQRRHGGVYSVQVSNAFDVAVSSNATLTVLVPPIQILGTGTSFSAPGHFTLNFTGDSNTVFAIETSTNLLDWTQTGTVTNTTGTVLYDDGTAGSSPYRFYRLRIVP